MTKFILLSITIGALDYKPGCFKAKRRVWMSFAVNVDLIVPPQVAQGQPPDAPPAMYTHPYTWYIYYVHMYTGHMHVHTYACRVPAPWAFYHASCVGSAKGIVNLHVQRQKFLLKTRFMLSETAAAATRATELTKLRRLNPAPAPLQPQPPLCRIAWESLCLHSTF